jgi:hypothetical protein
LTPANPEQRFGFDILTERKKPKYYSGYESGESTMQHGEQYSDDAAILQSILEYSDTYGSENYFTSWEISKNHLLDNCRYYVELYKESKAKKGVRIK